MMQPLPPWKMTDEGRSVCVQLNYDRVIPYGLDTKHLFLSRELKDEKHLLEFTCDSLPCQAEASPPATQPVVNCPKCQQCVHIIIFPSSERVPKKLLDRYRQLLATAPTSYYWNLDDDDAAANP